jgi:hypothetical protein
VRIALRVRTPFQRAAQGQGWADILAFFGANPGRTYHARRALCGESRNVDEPSHFTLVSARRIDADTFEQRVQNAPPEFCTEFKAVAERGEDGARRHFDSATPGNGLQWKWVIRWRPLAFPVVLAMERPT